MSQFSNRVGAMRALPPGVSVVLAELGAEVAGVDVGDDRPRVVVGAEEVPGRLVESELLGSGQLDDAVHRFGRRNLGQGGGDVIGRFGLDEDWREADRVAVGVRNRRCAR